MTTHHFGIMHIEHAIKHFSSAVDSLGLKHEELVPVLQLPQRFAVGAVGSISAST